MAAKARENLPAKQKGGAGNQTGRAGNKSRTSFNWQGLSSACIIFMLGGVLDVIVAIWSWSYRVIEKGSTILLSILAGLVFFAIGFFGIRWIRKKNPDGVPLNNTRTWF